MTNNLIFNGFLEGKIEFKEAFQRKLNDLLEIAPSDSGTYSEITKIESGYSGMLKLMSSYGKFEVKASEAKFEDMEESLFSQMYLHIQTWRRLR